MVLIDKRSSSTSYYKEGLNVLASKGWEFGQDRRQENSSRAFQLAGPFLHPDHTLSSRSQHRIQNG